MILSPYISGSISKADSAWLGFDTLEAATRHAGYMNDVRDTYESGKGWNYSNWPTKPGPWMAKLNPEYVALAVEAMVK